MAKKYCADGQNNGQTDILEWTMQLNKRRKIFVEKKTKNQVITSLRKSSKKIVQRIYFFVKSGHLAAVTEFHKQMPQTLYIVTDSRQG